MSLNRLTQTTLRDAFLTFYGLQFVPLTVFYKRAFCFGFGKILVTQKSFLHAFFPQTYPLSPSASHSFCWHTNLKGLDLLKSLP